MTQLSRREEWLYVFRYFPLIDLPFNALAIILSEHWIASLCLAVCFPIIATATLHIADKKGWQPGLGLLGINGPLFLFYIFISGPASPTWLSAINVTVGSSYWFNNPRIGQWLMVAFSLLIGGMNLLIGADPIYALTITLILLSFILLFSRAHSFMTIQKKRIENKNEEITDSINYAKRIQYAVLPQPGVVANGIPGSFITYLPRDIVSGDFYWYHEIDKDNYIFVSADCTGHGVPGAFMTVIGTSLLNQIVMEKKITKPSVILEELDKGIFAMLNQGGGQQISIQDGMDLALIKVNRATKELIITSAKRPSVLINKGELRELKGSKFTLGGIRTGDKTFEEIVVRYENGDMLYLFTDGYPDQFGGSDNKKFMIRRFRALLSEINTLPVAQQKEKMEAAFSEWKGKNEQTDDVLVAGIRF